MLSDVLLRIFQDFLIVRTYFSHFEIDGQSNLSFASEMTWNDR